MPNKYALPHSVSTDGLIGPFIPALGNTFYDANNFECQVLEVVQEQDAFGQYYRVKCKSSAFEGLRWYSVKHLEIVNGRWVAAV